MSWQEILKKPNKGKRFVSKKGTSYGQAGKAKDGKDRIRPNTSNNLSRRKWKCHGNKSSA